MKKSILFHPAQPIACRLTKRREAGEYQNYRVETDNAHYDWLGHEPIQFMFSLFHVFALLVEGLCPVHGFTTRLLRRLTCFGLISLLIQKVKLLFMISSTQDKKL